MGSFDPQTIPGNTLEKFDGPGVMRGMDYFASTCMSQRAQFSIQKVGKVMAATPMLIMPQENHRSLASSENDQGDERTPWKERRTAEAGLSVYS